MHLGQGLGFDPLGVLSENEAGSVGEVLHSRSTHVVVLGAQCYLSEEKEQTKNDLSQLRLAGDELQKRPSCAHGASQRRCAFGRAMAVVAGRQVRTSRIWPNLG